MYICFVDLEKVLDRIAIKMVKWAMRKKGILKVLIRPVMRLYKGTKTGFRIDHELLEEFEEKVGIHQGSASSPFLFAVDMMLPLNWQERVCYVRS